MLAGHLGVAAAAKSFDRTVPFWALAIASYFLDVVFAILAAIGVEKMTTLEGTDGGYGELAFSVDYSHSFFGAIALSVLALLVGARWLSARGCMIIAGVVFSHWFFDSIVHRPDMPIVPGNAGSLPRVGLGMWDFPTFVIVMEAAMVIGGAYLWFRSTRTAPTTDAPAQRRLPESTLALASGIGGLVMLAFDALA